MNFTIIEQILRLEFVNKDLLEFRLNNKLAIEILVKF